MNQKSKPVPGRHCLPNTRNSIYCCSSLSAVEYISPGPSTSPAKSPCQGLLFINLIFFVPLFKFLGGCFITFRRRSRVVFPFYYILVFMFCNGNNNHNHKFTLFALLQQQHRTKEEDQQTLPSSLRSRVKNRSVISTSCHEANNSVRDDDVRDLSPFIDDK